MTRKLTLARRLLPVTDLAVAVVTPRLDGECLVNTICVTASKWTWKFASN